LALRLYEFRGFGALDDAAYAQIAHQMASGMFRIGAYNGPAVFPRRVGIIYPTALLFRPAGVSEWTMVLFPFAISLLPIVFISVASRPGPRSASRGCARKAWHTRRHSAPVSWSRRSERTGAGASSCGPASR